MALDTYAGLQATLARLLNRDDLTDDIPGFIALFEADFDADPRTAKHRRRICRSQAVIENEYETLPTNYLGIQSITLETDPIRRLQYAEPDLVAGLTEDEDAWEARDASEFGSTPAPPKRYTIVGTEIRFFPPPQTSYTCDMTVYERLAVLSDENTANWLLTYFPNIYLYGSAIHSAPFLGADARLTTWQGLYDRGVEKLMASDPTPTDKTMLRTDLGHVGRHSNLRCA